MRACFAGPQSDLFVIFVSFVAKTSWCPSWLRSSCRTIGADGAEETNIRGRHVVSGRPGAAGAGGGQLRRGGEDGPAAAPSARAHRAARGTDVLRAGGGLRVQSRPGQIVPLRGARRTVALRAVSRRRALG